MSINVNPYFYFATEKFRRVIHRWMVLCLNVPIRKKREDLRIDVGLHVGDGEVEFTFPDTATANVQYSDSMS